MCIQYTLKALGQNVLRSVTWLTFKRQIERKEHEQLFCIGFLCSTSQIFYSSKVELKVIGVLQCGESHVLGYTRINGSVWQSKHPTSDAFWVTVLLRADAEPGDPAAVC